MVAYNFIVDSNVETPATYAPTSAMLAIHVCNEGATPLTNVEATIGNFDPNGDGVLTDNSPGIYPSRTNPTTGQAGTFSLVHEGGSAGLADATRFIGDLPAGECSVQYWLVSYPRLDSTGTTVTRGIKPFDDLWLEYDFWATAQSGATTLRADVTRRAYMRNEISAMANKIWPNTTSKVPNEYLAAISDPLGWSTQAEDGSAVGTPGELITTKGVWFDLGNIGAGFDNDGDLVPDRNAWLQPVGDPSLFDAGCFRLVKAHGLLIIKLNDGTEELIEFEDQLYFEHIPGNNTGGVGIVQYDFAVLNGGCSAAATPYQEVASGYDNEKFNFDFGQQPPLLTSAAPTVVLAKSAEPARVTPGQALTYTMAFTNTSARAVGHKRFGLPLVISDTIPAGTVYVAGSATSRNTPPSGRTYSLRYSTDHGRSWSLTEPSPAANITTLQWWLSDNLPGNGIGRVGYAVQVSNAYTLPVVPNVATASFGGSVPFAESKTQTPVTGLNRLTGTVFADMGASRGNGLKESDESGIPAVLLTLGIDLDNDGDADLESSSIDTNASGTYTFTDLMDGAYIVTVDVLDTALAGYAPTTPITRAVDLDAGRTNSSAVVRSNIDFGFAAALTLDKALVNTGEIYPGQLITFTIAANSLSNSSACITTTWAITNYPLSVQFFDNNPLAFGAGGPDGRYATANSANPPLLVSAHHFPLAALPGTITKVEAVYSVVLTGTITDDQVNVRLYDGFNSLVGNSVFAAADLNPFSGFPANQGLLVWDVTNLPGVPWSATFISNTVVSEIEFVKNGGASDPATLNLDAVGIRVTTDQSCTALNPVALQDSYDASQLEFVTATPSASSTTPAGTLRWNNIGPLTPGTPQTVTTVFRAKEAAAGNSTLNQAAASVVLTGSAGMTVTDSAAVTVAVPGSIGDTLFWDANVNGMQDWDEMGIGSVLLSLYRDSNGNGTYDAGVDPLSATRTTDVSGQYFFTNVIPATYFVRVGAITGTPTLSADPDADGAPCPSGGSSACDGQHRVVLANGERYIAADFGYRPPSSLGDTVWIDLDNDGLRDDGEVGLPFITVNLTGAATLSTTTDIDGYYRFIGLNDGNYTVSIDLSDPDLPTGLLPTKDPGTAVGTADGSSTATLVSGAVTALGGTACTNCNLDADFGLRLPGSLNLSGTICFDNAAAQDGACGTSGSGTLSPENPLSTVGARLYRWIDDNDNLAEPNELLLLGRVDTDAAGDYAFSGLPAARYLVSSLAPLDRLTSTTQTGSNPAVLSVQKVLAATENRHTIQQVVQATTTITNVDFAYLTQDVYDFGDLPAPYSTRLEQKPAGAYHTFDGSSTLRLGTLVDTEGNGTLSTLADGDGADEDGVSIPAGQVWINGSGSVAVAAGASGALLGWVDFDGDGDFLESSERVISQTVSAGTATYTFPVPNGTFGNGRRSLPARFRLFANTPTWPQLAMAGTGASKPVAGEVEDYLFSTGLTIDLDTLTPQTSAGGQVTYVVSVANTGTLPLSGIVITSVLPTGFTYAQSTLSEQNATRTGSTNPTVGAARPVWGTWRIDPAGRVLITQVVNVAGNVQPGIYDSDSQAWSLQIGMIDDDGLTAQDSDTPPSADPENDEDVEVVVIADLALDKSANTLTPAIGGPIVFTVHITNTGPSDAPGVTVSDTLPSGYTLLGSSATAGSYQSNSGLWTLGTLANGASARLVVTATVNASGPYTNFAEVATSAPTDPDSIPGNGDPNAPDEDDEDSVTPLPCTTTVSGRICQDTDGNGLCDGANQPLANVLMTLIPQNGTPGKILMQRTDANGEVLFTDNRDRFVVPGNYLLQVQDAYLNNVDGLYPTASSLFFFSVASCQNTSRDFGYATGSRGAVGDLVWYDANGNGLQDEWYDANNDGQVTPNTPDANGNFDFDQYEWYDINNNGTYDQPTDELELRACGLFAANLSLNDNEATTISGILGYYRFRPSVLNRTHSVTLSPTDPGLLTAAAAMQATGLCKSYTDPQPGRSPQRLISPSATAAACALTTGSTQTSKVLTAAPPISNSQDLNLDYGIRCEARGRVEGTVYIDENSDGLYTPATDTPIDTVTVAITDSLGFTYTVETDANGFFSQSVPSGDTTVLVDELDPEFPEDADLTVPNGAANGDNTNPATVSVPTAGTAVKNTGYRLRQLNVTATPVCVNDIPYLEYNVTPVNFVPVTNTVTVRWLNAADDSVLYTYANQPLSQRMLWPETVVDSNGIGIEWPGWDLVNNEWVPVPTLVRPQAKVEFSINPTAVVTVTYPQPTATCYTDPHASIGDRVWLDQNMDGRQDLNETGLPNIEVRLFDSSGSLISTTVSDNSGHYQFWITVQGAYFLEAMAPAGYLFSPQNQGDDSGDTDANEIGVTGLVTVTTLTRDNTVDFGIFDDSVNVSLGDYIWADNNFNGIQDGGEPGLPGVRVNLYRDENDNGLLDAGDTYLAFRVTDASGFYRFTSLPTDDYLVHVDASNFPPGGALEDYTNTEGHQDPDDYNDIDDNGVLVTNLIGGYASRAATVLPWSEDLQRNPTTRAIVIRNPTIDFGFHIKQAEIGDQVWLDSDGDGQQDPGEPGLPGVAVALYNVVGNSLVTTTVSNGLGNFGFVDVPAGEYYLIFTPPASFQFTAADQGNDVIDSDPNPATGQTPSFLLTPGDNVVTLDAGLTTTLLPASLGDRVWYDANQNGRQDTGEKGLAGVQVRLSREGALLATTATDSAGLYSFAALAPGNYQLEFVLPAGYTATASDQGGDDLLDSDVDPATGRTAPIALAAGQSNRSVDLGVLVPSGQQPGNLAAIVWYDANLNNLWEGEQGVPGILVQLFDGSNSLIGQAVTTGDGQVLFPNLIPGTYHLGTPSLNGYLPVTPGAGTPENSSQLDPGALQTSPIAVAGGATSQQQIGLWAAVGTASIRVLQPAAIGNLVWQDNNENGAQDTGEPGAAGATVMLYTGNGVLLSTDSTAADGNYLFPSLLPGNYYLEFVPAGSATQFSPLGGGSPALDSDADPGTGRTATITVAENELNFDVDAGMINIPTSLPETEEPFTIVGQIYLPMVATE